MFRVRCSTAAVCLLSVLFLWGCEGGGDGDQALDISTGDIQSPVDVRLVHGTLFVVRAVVNGAVELDMLVDTGASKTWVPADIFGNSGGTVPINSLCLENDVCFYNFTAQSSDSGFTQSRQGYFNGIIGMDLLENFDLTLDYRGEAIYFCDCLEKDFSDPVVIPIEYQSNRPFSSVSIESMPQEAATLLDTGAAYTRITAPMLDALSQNPEVLFKSVVFGFDASEIAVYMPINRYCVGTACPDEVIVQIGSWPAVGGTFFREYLTVFRFSENAVKLDRYPDRNHIRESGLQRVGLQVNIKDATEIVYVVEGSFAWQTGLSAGDEMISINGIPVSSLGYFGIYDLLSDTAIDAYQLIVHTPTGDVENISMSID